MFPENLSNYPTFIMVTGLRYYVHSTIMNVVQKRIRVWYRKFNKDIIENGWENGNFRNIFKKIFF